MKSKITVLSILILITSASLKAQTAGELPSTGYVSLNLGIGANAYQPRSYNNNYGYYWGGYDANLSLAFPISHSHFGIAATVYHTNGTWDPTNYINNYTASYPDGYIYSGGGYSNGNFSATTLMVGGFLTYGWGRWVLDVKLLGGEMFATLPSVSIVAYNEISYTDFDNENGAGSYNAANSNAFALDFGSDLRYMASTKISIMLGMDDFIAQPTFSTAQQNVDASGNLSQQKINISTLLIIQNITLGVGYTF
jgi:hypothetical protein